MPAYAGTPFLFTSLGFHALSFRSPRRWVFLSSNAARKIPLPRLNTFSIFPRFRRSLGHAFHLIAGRRRLRPVNTTTHSSPRTALMPSLSSISFQGAHFADIDTCRWRLLIERATPLEVHTRIDMRAYYYFRWGPLRSPSTAAARSPRRGLSRQPTGRPPLFSRDARAPRCARRAFFFYRRRARPRRQGHWSSIFGQILYDGEKFPFIAGSRR